MVFFMPAAALDTVTQNVYEEMSSITLLSIPLFILKGAAIGRSPRRPRPLLGAACLDEPHPRRPRHRQRLRLRAVRRDGGLEPGDLLGDRLGRHPGDAQARLSRRLRGRPDRRRRHARHPAAALDHHDPLRRRRRSSRSAGCSWPASARRCCWSRSSPPTPPGATAARRRRAARACRRRRARPCSTSTTRSARSSPRCRACCRSCCC